MTSNIVKSLVMRNEYHLVSNYIVGCLRSRIPESTYKDHGDWEQDISLFIMSRKSVILSANDATKFIFKSVWDKIKNAYRDQNTANSALSGLKRALEAIPPTHSKFNDESITDSLIRVSIKELKMRFPKDEAVNKLLIDYITSGENHTRDRILKLMSRASFTRKKSTVTKIMKNRLSETLDKEYLCKGHL